MSSLFDNRLPIAVRPSAWQNVVQVVFRHPLSADDARFNRTVLESTPGCIRVVESSGSFQVEMDDNSPEAHVAAQCYIERELGLPHRFACRWFDVIETWYVERVATIDGLYFLEPVAPSMASTILARMRQLQVEPEVLHMEPHRLLLRCIHNLRSGESYEDKILGTGTELCGVHRQEGWDPAWEPRRLLERMNWH